MKTNIFSFLTLLTLYLPSLFGKEIIISLPTEKSTPNIYLCQCISKSTTLSNLTNHILKNDFLLDGRSLLANKTPELINLEKNKGDRFFLNPLWKKNKIQYVIIPSINNNVFSLELFHVRKGSIQSLSTITLSKEKKDNIMTLHNVSDFLFELIFGEKGIASKKILYSFHRQTKEGAATNWNAEIYQTDSLGLFHERQTFDNNYGICPEYIPKKNNQCSNFLYVSYKIGQPQIYLHQNNQPPRSLIKLRGNQLLPKVSYDGKYLSFVSDASGTSDIFIQPLEHSLSSKPIQIYSAKHQTNASPHLSPDNSKIVFVNDKTGCAKLYLADIKNTLLDRKFPKLERIKSPCSECTCPCFSPDGKKIAFSGKVNGRRQIWLYDIDNKTVIQLTSGSEDKENPSFGSNSKHLVYNTTTPSKDLFILNIENRKIRRLTEGAGSNHYPSFEK